jgi:hypothetical protein
MMVSITFQGYLEVLLISFLGPLRCGTGNCLRVAERSYLVAVQNSFRPTRERFQLSNFFFNENCEIKDYRLC